MILQSRGGIVTIIGRPNPMRRGKKRHARPMWRATFICRSKAEALRLDRLFKEMRSKRREVA